MNPAMAAELMGMDATETGSFNKLEKEILIKINKYEALYPSLCPAPVHAPAAATATVATKVGSFKLEMRRLPKFKGTLTEYPTFKKDWQTQVASTYGDQIQLYKLRELQLVPAKDKIHVEKFNKVNYFWSYMDVKYGDKDELMRDRLAYLRNYSRRIKGCPLPCIIFIVLKKLFLIEIFF